MIFAPLDEIAAQLTTAFTDEEKAAWVVLFRQYDQYHQSVYPDLEGKLTDATAIQIKQLRWVLAKLQAFNAQGFECAQTAEMNDNGIKVSGDKERIAYLDYALNVLFEKPASSAMGTVPRTQVGYFRGYGCRTK
jgi:hypothetical protein